MKLLALVCVFALVLGACQKADSEKGTDTASGTEAAEGQETGDAAAAGLNEVGTYPISDETTEMSMFRLSMPNVVDFETNDFTKYMEELTNIHWSFETAGQDNSEEAVNLAMTAGKDMPDVFLFAVPDVAKYGVTEQMLVPIEDMIADNMPNFSKYLEANPGLLAQITQTDGHIYGLPAINDCYHCLYRNKMWVNTAHLAELGKEVPTTTEELKDVLAAYVEKFPNGVGISGSPEGWGQQFEDWIVNAFILDPGTTNSSAASGKKVLNTESKQIESIATKDEYREALKYLNELFEMGAIYDGSFTQNAEQFRALMNQEGDPVLFAPYGTISDGFDVAERPESYAAYDVLAPVKGPEGVQNATYFMYDGVIENRLVITTNCENPAAVLRWTDYFYTLEGYLSMQYGADKDTDWVLNPEGEKGLGGDPALYKVNTLYSSEAQNHDWQDVGLNFATAENRLGEATAQDIDPKSAEGLEKLLFDASKNMMEPYGQDENSPYQVLPALKLTSEESDELQVIEKEVNDHINNSRTAFIRGDLDINDDAAWQAYVDELELKGLSKLLEINQTAYDRQTK